MASAGGARLPARLLLSAFAGASAWLSLGTLAVTNAQTLSRIAGLPPLWLLPVLIAAMLIVMTVWLPHSRGEPLALAVLLWLPYLPMKIPPAFLMWQGPIEGLLWCIIAAGLVWDHRRRSVSRLPAWAEDPHRAPYLAAAISAVCATGAFTLVQGVVPSGDEPHYLVMTQSLLLDGDLQIENNHRRGDYFGYYMWEFGPHYVRRGVDGQIYSHHMPGISAIVLPGFALAGYPGAVATVIGLTAAAGAVAWQAAWILTADATAAWIGWAAVFLTAPYFLLSFTIYPDGVAGLLTIVGIRSLVQFAAGGPVRRSGLVAASIALALLPWLHARLSIVALTIGLTLAARVAARPTRLADCVSLLTAPAISCVAWFLYFWVIWGTPDPRAPWGSQSLLAFGHLGTGLLGLLTDQQFGLVSNAPVYAIAAIGLASLARHRVRLAGELLLIILSYTCVVSMYEDWWGGVASPARFLGALMPLAVLPVAWWWRQSSGASRALTMAALVISMVAVVPRIAVGHGALLYNDRDGFDTVLDWATRGADLPMALPSVHRGTLTALADAAIWLMAGLIVSRLVTLRADRRQRNPAASWAIATLGIAAASMVAASVVWARHQISGTADRRSRLAAVGEWNPTWQPTTVALRPVGWITPREFLDRLQLSTTDRAAGRDASVLFSASSLPAGDYELTAAGTATLSCEVEARIGDSGLATDRWRFENRRPGFTGEVLHLPVFVRHLTILGDPQAVRSVSAISLSARRLAEPGRIPVGVAHRAARYGLVRVFAMDDAAFLEPSGAWTHGDASTTIVIDASAAPPGAGLRLRFRSGPMATPVELRERRWRDAFTLSAQSEHEVTVPPSEGGHERILTIRTGIRFRPMDYDGSSGDGRALGVWVEFP